MDNRLLFPELIKIFNREFNPENIINDLVTVSSNSFAFVIETYSELPKDRIENVKRKIKEISPELTNSEFENLLNHQIREITESKKVEDIYFEKLFTNFRFVDVLFFQDLTTNIHKFKVIGNRISTLIEVLKIQEDRGRKTRLKDFENLLYLIKEFLPDYEFPEITDEQVQRLDKRLKVNSPSNKQKLKALQEFCPELMDKLSKCSKEEQKDVIHLITGVNKEDSYKLLFTADKRQINEFTIDIDGIDFETLKNKLKNTHLSK